MRPDFDTLSLHQKIEGYLLESSAKVVKNMPKNNTLKFVLPFAAATVMPTIIGAQCDMGAFNPMGGAYGDGQIDVDLDGNPDFDFDISGNNLWITAVGSMGFGGYYVATYGVNFASTLGYGAPIGAGSFLGAPAFGFVNSITASGTQYIPIQDAAGNLGFIEITFTGSGYTINLVNTGIGNVTTSVDAGDCATILPVELTSFDVKPINKQLALSWTTASEVNNFGFEVQRSMDGRSFQKVAWVKGEGNSNKEMSYSFVDSKVKPNVEYYYRLKQIDYDGRSEMSDIRSGKMVDGSALSIGEFFPNPVSTSSAVRLEVVSGAVEDMTLSIYNNVGQMVQSSLHTLSVGSNELNIATQGLPSGNYYAKMQIGDSTEYKKLIITE